MKNKTLPQLIKELDKWFSLYIRQKDANFKGFVKCYTCDKKMNWKESDAGHYIKRNHLGARWDERNVKPQCARCNRWLNGNQDEFAVRLMEDYGSDILEELQELKRTVFKPTREGLKQQIEIYKLKVGGK